MTPDERVILAKKNRQYLLEHLDDKILAMLEERFQTNIPAYQLNRDGHYCPIAAAIRDGQREVILYLRHQLQLAKQEAKNN